MDTTRWLEELRRRRVFRVLIGYGIASFAILQVVEPVMHGLHLPEWVLSIVVVALGIGFPLAVTLAWAFDLTSSGIERTRAAGGGVPQGPRLALLLLGLGGIAAAPGLLYYFVWRDGSAPVRLSLVAAGAALVAGGAALFFRPGRRSAPPPPGPAPREPQGPSVAVLPFADMSPAKDQDFFCDGIAEEILNALCGVSGLRVAARSSSFQFKGRSVDSREASRFLGVSTLLEGSVRKAGDTVRVAAQLVSGADGYQIWSASFDRGLEDIFAIQEEIAQAVVRALKLQLSPGEETRLRRPGTKNLQAYEMYLKGRQFLMSHAESGFRFARQMFRGAIELDPGYAQAHAGLADTCFMSLQWHIEEARAEEFRAEGLRASEEALRIDPDLAEGLVARANMLSLVGRGEDAERDFLRATELNPALPDARYFYARFLWPAGRLEEAVRQFEEAVRLNPDDYASFALLVTLHHGAGEEDKARDAARRTNAAVERRLRLTPDDVRALYMGAGADLRYGDRARGFERLARALDLMPNDFSTLYNVACGYAQAGESEKALDLLDRAVATGRGFRRWIENDADLAPLRGSPRFRAIVERVKY
ncbi:MAG TPA: tetratricopeptide repeat protein [Anaeromyxobacteraceae bacterium]|nr:tetratricopeptide repeat protein [Anaeromyxobacteraceae bacterium]